MKFSICRKILISSLIILYFCHIVYGSESFSRKSLKNGSISKVHKKQKSVVPVSSHSLKAERRQLSDDSRTLLTTILNASGVLGLGFLWIKEITAALGTPILAPVLMPPLFAIAIGVLFFPNIGRVIESILFPMSPDSFSQFMS